MRTAPPIYERLIIGGATCCERNDVDDALVWDEIRASADLEPGRRNGLHLLTGKHATDVYGAFDYSQLALAPQPGTRSLAESVYPMSDRQNQQLGVEGDG